MNNATQICNSCENATPYLTSVLFDKENDNIFVELIESASIAYQTLDENNRIVAVNDAWCKLLGYSREEAIGKRFADLLGVDSYLDFNHILSKQKISGKCMHCELVMIHKDTRNIIVDISMNSHLDEEISIRQTVCILKRASREKQLGKVLKRCENLVSAFMDIPAALIILVDRKGRIMYANKNFADMIGLSEISLAGIFIDSLFTQEVAQKRKAFLKKAISSRKTVRFEEKINSSWYETVVNPIFDDDRKLHIVAIHSQDISHRIRTEEAYRQLQEREQLALIGQAAGRMAHDVNNVLGIIMGTGHLLKGDNLPSDVLERIEVILQASSNGRNITRELIRVAQDNSPNLEFFHLNERISMVLKSLQPDLKNIQLEKNWGSDMRLLEADKGLLDNALINLIQNSIHAMSLTKNPRLRIDTYEENNNICIEIEDNGCGIPKECGNSIYDPTMSLKGADDVRGAYSPGVKGTGYGMFNVKRFVDKHRGTIQYDSEMGKGTVFKVSLPLNV